MIGTALGIFFAALGVFALQIAWSRRLGGVWILAGWGLLSCGVFGWRLAGDGLDKAVAVAFLAPSLTAFALLVLRAELTGGPRKPRSFKPIAASRPPEKEKARRAFIRAMLAGPLAGASAFSLAAATALRAPWQEADRLVAAGLLAPLLWALGGVWATTDRKLSRISLGLTTALAASIAATVL